ILPSRNSFGNFLRLRPQKAAGSISRNFLKSGSLRGPIPQKALHAGRSRGTLSIERQSNVKANRERGKAQLPRLRGTRNERFGQVLPGLRQAACGGLPTAGYDKECLRTSANGARYGRR